ncbi:MAG: hypothetical protein LBH44_05295 [Treponema sp.]|jgi:hypothetical protein|nr:hypothetical protein [Treponema sp.]
MKNTIKLFGIVVMVAIICFSMIACDEDGTNPFVGMWYGTVLFQGESASASIDVTDSSWVFKCPSINMTETGTYTWSGSSATLEQKGVTYGTAAINGSTLTVTMTSGIYDGGVGTFTQN